MPNHKNVQTGTTSRTVPKYRTVHIPSMAFNERHFIFRIVFDKKSEQKHHKNSSKCGKKLRIGREGF